jgi:hypothetical protein
MCLSITIYVYMKEARPSVGYGSLHMHELSSGKSIWLAERMRLLTGREIERAMRSVRLILLLKACFLNSQSVPGRGNKVVAGFLYFLLTPVINKIANWKT